MAVLVKTINGLVFASVKTRNGLAVGSIKAINGLDTTSGGGAPGFDREVQRATGSFSGDGTYGITLTGSVAVGERVVVVFTHQSGITVSAVSDTKSNTYGIDRRQASGGSTTSTIVSAEVTSALASSDVITLTVTAANSWRGAVVLVLANTTAVDGSNGGSAFSTSISTSVTTTAESLIIGVLQASAAMTVSTLTGTQIGATYAPWSGGNYALFYQPEATSGSKTVGGSVSSSLNLGVNGVAYT